MNRFVLVGGNQQNLQQYLNSQVEVTGRLDQGTGRTGSGSTSGSATGTGSATGSGTGSTGGSGTGTGSATAGGQSTGRTSGADVQRLHVTSVRQISSTCASR